MEGWREFKEVKLSQLSFPPKLTGSSSVLLVDTVGVCEMVALSWYPLPLFSCVWQQKYL